MYRLLSKTITIDRGVDYRYISAWLVIDIYLYINFADVALDDPKKGSLFSETYSIFLYFKQVYLIDNYQLT